jgi:sugar lactone lactonase YvrE
MLRRIQSLPQGQRRIVFGAFIVGGLLLISGATVLLLVLSLNIGRDQSIALVEGVQTAEFAVLPDDDAYPAAVAVGVDGTVYTGSFVTGTVWSIAPDGTVSELPGTRGVIGAVAGLAAAPDGTLYIVDQLDASPLQLGGEIWQRSPDGELSTLPSPPDERCYVRPDDVAVDAAGAVYISDRGRGEVWRWDADTGLTLWWTPPTLDDEQSPAPTGLAYDPVHGALIVSDTRLNTLYRVAIASAEAELLYAHSGDFAPGFDGVTVGAAGTIYAAAPGQNGLVALRAGELEYLAGVFRGISDVAYADGRIYATNFDSFSLVVPLVRPRLPFALDVITLADAS